MVVASLKLGMTGLVFIPHIPSPSVYKILPYPLSPQSVPHEFLKRMYFSHPSVP